jgi:predicted RNase H-like HicB family nuclease
MPDDRPVRRADSGSWWVAEDPETGVTAQGLSREAARENLDEKLAGEREEPEPPDPEDREERVESENVIADLQESTTPWDSGGGGGADADREPSGRSRLRKALDRLRGLLGRGSDRQK